MEGEASGLNEEELKDGRDFVSFMETKAWAKAALDEAFYQYRQIPNVAPLQAAFTTAEEADVDAHDLEDAKAALEIEAKMAAAKADLREAAAAPFKKRYYVAADDPDDRELRNINIKALYAALAHAERADLFPNDDDMTLARKVLKQERQTEARDCLEDALTTQDLSQLQWAITEANDCGLDEETIAPAVNMVASTLRKVFSRTSLMAASKNRDIKALRESLSEAATAGLTESGPDDLVPSPKGKRIAVRYERELEEAQTILASEERKAAALIDIETALKVNNLEKLAAAVMEGEASGLPDGDLVHVKGALADAQRALARANLEFAIRHRNEEMMTAAIAEGEKIGLRPEILENGRNELFKQRRRVEARRHILQAEYCNDISTIKAAIRRGEEVELEEREVKRLKLNLVCLQRQARVADSVEVALQNALKGNMLFELRAAIKKAQLAGVDSHDLRVAKQKVAERTEEFEQERSTSATRNKSKHGTTVLPPISVSNSCGTLGLAQRQKAKVG